MLERAARSWELAPVLGLGVASGQPTRWKEVRGAAGLCRAVGVVGRGEQLLPREHRRSAPRALTVPKELTKGCLWGGSAPPNGSRLRWGGEVGRSHTECYPDRRAQPLLS